MNKTNHHDSLSSTPYDDVHRTLLNDCPQLIIPVVNEAFHQTHDRNEKVTLFNNEVFINKQGGNQTERVTDSNFLIGTTRYHLECQSTTDGTMILRIFEYDSQLALQDSTITGEHLTVRFPKTAILYLRHNKNTPDYMRITIQAPDASCTYRVPVMKVQNYTLDEIFEKNLLFLIPFHIFSYEKNFSEYESNEKKLHELQKVYDEIITRLKKAANQHLIDEFTRSSILDMSKKVLEHIARKYANIKKGLGDIMGGKILDYPAKDILNKGRAEGNKEHLVSLIQKKLVKGKSVEVIADEVEETVDTVLEIMKELKHTP